MTDKRDKIAKLQQRLFKMNGDGWITYGQVERHAKVYRNWCKNFVSGNPDKMTMDDASIDRVNAILQRILDDIGALA